MKLLPFSFLAFEATVRALELQIPISTSAVKDIPHLGFGTWNLDKANASEVVSVALQTGYRHIDCAAAYSNQKEVGQGLVDGMNKARIDRSQVWITSKLWNAEYANSTTRAFKKRRFSAPSQANTNVSATNPPRSNPPSTKRYPISAYPT